MGNSLRKITKCHIMLLLCVVYLGHIQHFRCMHYTEMLMLFDLKVLHFVVHYAKAMKGRYEICQKAFYKVLHPTIIYHSNTTWIFSLSHSYESSEAANPPWQQCQHSFCMHSQSLMESNITAKFRNGGFNYNIIFFTLCCDTVEFSSFFLIIFIQHRNALNPNVIVGFIIVGFVFIVENTK